MKFKVILALAIILVSFAPTTFAETRSGIRDKINDLILQVIQKSNLTHTSLVGILPPKTGDNIYREIDEMIALSLTSILDIFGK